MFERIWRAFRNDATVYKDFRTNAAISSESFVAILLGIGLGVIIETMRGGFIGGIIVGLNNLIGYLFLSFWAWFIGTKLSKGDGSFSDVRKALAYAYCIPAVLIPIPWLGLLAGLWLLIIASSAIRETLGIGKGMTFFIVLSEILALFLLSAVG